MKPPAAHRGLSLPPRVPRVRHRAAAPGPAQPPRDAGLWARHKPLVVLLLLACLGLLLYAGSLHAAHPAGQASGETAVAPR